ncbi:hypothetical protein MSG28_006164 [Choristoneura fumiferana]|uniref:Uncharacterized protein n=1 Tax=Choristoneura fumiferana TaxID=7141 RepID=A0ACC0JE23_CHOFU|nr:hypothetical protein MSG28_006164 [Choristoneura fumiferana]
MSNDVLLLFAVDASGLLCYNGTFTSLQFGDDPLASRGAFSPRERAIERLRCASTVPCGGLATLNTKYASVKRTGATRRNHTSHTERYSS